MPIDATKGLPIQQQDTTVRTWLPVAVHQGAAWRAALVLIVGVTVLRLVYSIWFSPWDLVGDEAYYWAQAQHLDFGYNEKGPLLAWMIAAACRLFGDVEWAVRLPMVIASGLSAWGIGRLAISASKGDERIGAIAVALFLLLPAFQASAQISTQDGPMIALWIALTGAGMRLFRRWRSGLNTWPDWLLIWALLGVGMLLKQSVLTFLPGMAIFWWLSRRELPLRPVFVAQQVVGVLICAAVFSPMIIWNARHGWPTLAHTIGHLGAGGDQAGRVQRGNVLIWEGNVIAGLLGSFGPAGLVMVWATVHFWRTRPTGPADTSPQEGRSELWFDRLWLVCAAWFSTIFFVALALTKPVLASWPLPSMVPLVVIVAQVLTPIVFGDAPGKHLRRFWKATVLYGVAAGLLLAFPNVLLYVPGLTSVIQKRMMGQLHGAREHAARLAAVITQAEQRGGDGRPPLVVAPNYGLACLASFYLPGHPPVASRDKILANRPSTLDQWPETNLESPAHFGRTLVLILDRNDPVWEEVFVVDRVLPSGDPDYLIATNFQGFPTGTPAPKISAAGKGRP